MSLIVIKARVIEFLIVLTQLSYFVIQAHRDPDPYHDGFAYTQALASSVGKIPNRDFLALYGPLNPFVQGLWLRFTTDSLLSLRIFTSILLTAIGLLIYLGTKKFLGKRSALLISFVWAIGNPFTTTPTLPWPNILLTLFLITSIFLLRKAEEGKYLYLILAGISLTLSVLIRNVALISLVAITLAILLVRKNRLKNLINFYLGIILTASISLIIILKLDMWNEFYNQTIIYGFSLSHNDRPIRGLINFRVFLYGSMFFAIIYALLKLQLRKNNSYSSKIIYFIFSLGSIGLIVFSGAIQQSRNQNSSASLNMAVNAKLFLENLIFMPQYSIVFIAIVILIRKVLTQKEMNNQNLMPFILSVSSLSQLYPGAHPSRIWFVIPALAIGVAPEIGDLIRINKKDIIRLSDFLFISTLISLLIVFYMQSQLLRVNYQNSVLIGMQGKKEIVIPVDKTIASIEKFAKKGNIEFRCPDGIYSTSGRSYLSIDNQYVILIPPISHTQPNANQIFFCHAKKPYFDLFDSSEYKVIFENEAEFPYLNSFNLLIERK